MRPLERQLTLALMHSQSCFFCLTFRLLHACWFKSCTLSRAACLHFVIIGPLPSRWINHSAVAIWWAGIALVILIWILWNGEYEQVVNASGRRASMMFTNATWMEKCFQLHRDNFESLFWQHLIFCDLLSLKLKRTQTFSLRSVMERTFIAPVWATHLRSAVWISCNFSKGKLSSQSKLEYIAYPSWKT